MAVACSNHENANVVGLWQICIRAIHFKTWQRMHFVTTVPWSCFKHCFRTSKTFIVTKSKLTLLHAFDAANAKHSPKNKFMFCCFGFWVRQRFAFSKLDIFHFSSKMHVGKPDSKPQTAILAVKSQVLISNCERIVGCHHQPSPHNESTNG